MSSYLVNRFFLGKEKQIPEMPMAIAAK